MRRRDILKAFLFSSSTVSALASNGHPAPELTEEPQNHSQFFSSKWHRVPDSIWDSNVLLAQPSNDWCIKSGELLCLVQMPDRSVNLKTHELSGDLKPFRAEMVLRFIDETADIALIENYIGFRFGPESKIDGSGDGIEAGITSTGHLFIGNSISDKRIAQGILKEKIRLVLSVIPQSTGGCFGKLKALDQAGNTVVTLSSTEYQSSQWQGSIAILCHFTGAEIKAESPPVAISKLEISGEKLRYHSEFEAGIHNKMYNPNT
jgi:alkaline phosphatase D